MKTVHFDIDTQIDFLYPAGALYVPGAERIVPAIARLNHYAAAHSIPVVSTMCAHSENDPEFRDWPPHCIVGTTGQLKPQSTLVPSAIILEKQQLDLFTSPRLRPLLEELAADAYVVYGVVTEYCVSYAALGLLATGRAVTLVTDAIQSLSAEAARKTVEDFTSRGGHLITADQLVNAR
jgi:nicotinamidase/pyrazinamidase